MDNPIPTLPVISSTSMPSVRGLWRVWRAALGASAASALALCALQPAFATNGVVDINQARALAGGVTAGDTPGFPITISESGSYRLTSNIDITGVASPLITRAIQITAPDVTLDLNGFSVIGPVNCAGTGASISCSPVPPLSNGAELIYANSAAVRLSLRNGTVRGAGGSGVYLEASDTTIRDLTSMFNFEDGVRFLTGTAEGVRVLRNKARGMYIGGNDSASSRIYAKGNGSTGVVCGSPAYSRVYQVHAVDNAGLGLQNCTIESSHLANNSNGFANAQLLGVDVGNNVCYHSAANTTCP